jgi:hypothetical protein
MIREIRVGVKRKVSKWTDSVDEHVS